MIRDTTYNKLACKDQDRRPTPVTLAGYAWQEDMKQNKQWHTTSAGYCLFVRFLDFSPSPRLLRFLVSRLLEAAPPAHRL